MITFYLITVGVSLIYVVATGISENISTGLLRAILICFLPPLNIILVFAGIIGVIGVDIKFHNPFKRNPKEKEPKPTKCEFANFVEWYSRAKESYLYKLYLATDYGIDNKMLKLRTLFENKRESPYYSGSLLNSLERTFILWCDGVFDVDYNKDRIYNAKIKPKQEFTNAHIKFLNELIESAQIIYDWIDKQEKRDRDEEKRAQQEMSDKLNHEFTEVIKSMKSDLNKIYKGE